MMTSTAEPRSSSLIEIGQVTAVLAPFLYLIGQKFATGYFNHLGCAWVANFLTFQETLTYAFLPALFVLTGAFFAYAMFSQNATAKTQLLLTVVAPVCVIAILFIAAIFWEVPAGDISLKVINIWLCMIFGFYSVEAIHAYKQPRKRGFSQASVYAFSSAFSLVTLSSGIGTMVATSDLERIDARFPIVSETGVFGDASEQRLIAKVSDRFLIMETLGEKRGFYLKSNLDTRKVRPMTRPL